MTKEEKLQRTSALLEKINQSAQEQEQALLTIGRKLYTDLTVDCLKLITKINRVVDNTEDTSQEYNEDEAEIFDLERRYAGLKGSSSRTLIMGGVLAFICVIILLKFYGGELQLFLTDFFGVKNTSKYIVLGIGGAVIYFVTEGFTKGDGGSPLKEGGITFQTLIAQIAYAVIIPVVVVVLFFSADDSGAVKGADNTAALFSFAAGYSSKLVVMLLNKIVEKGEQIIKTL